MLYKKVFIYIRVGNPNQLLLPIELQMRLTKEKALALRVQLEKEKTNIIVECAPSYSLEQRPKLSKLMKNTKLGLVDTLFVYRHDRLASNLNLRKCVVA